MDELKIDDKKFTLRAPKALHERLREDALKHHRSLHGQILSILEGSYDEDWLTHRLAEIRKRK